jgi:hypothetical protein
METRGIFDQVVLPGKKDNTNTGVNNFEDYTMKRKTLEVISKRNFIENFKIKESDLLFTNRQHLFNKIQDYVNLEELMKKFKNKIRGDSFSSSEGNLKN